MRRRMLLVKRAQPVEDYLRVTPETVQWVTMTDPVVYGIESNTDWNIT